MQKGVKKSTFWPILVTVVVLLLLIFIVLPLVFSSFTMNTVGNVAVIEISGPIMGSSGGGSFLGDATVSSSQIVQFIEQADANIQVQAIMLEINSPGGSAVASDEIASAIKRAKKPVVALIREAGASGGYWIASAADHIVAHRMSITGSIGVISSYLEFSGLMENYGVEYERLVAGKYKDSGIPFKELTLQERNILQTKLDTIHDFFIEEVAQNRNLPEAKVRTMATGEFFLGVEAKELGLVDQLGDKKTVEEYFRSTHNLSQISYITYRAEPTFFDLLAGVFDEFSFTMGEGIGSAFVTSRPTLMV